MPSINPNLVFIYANIDYPVNEERLKKFQKIIYSLSMVDIPI